MKYNNVINAVFVRRPNRFIAICDIDGEIVKAHVRNTGRCRELLVQGVKVYLEKSDQVKRKTGYTLIAVEKGERVVNIDSIAPNKVVLEAINTGQLRLPDLQKPATIKSEKQFYDSRFDLYLETDASKAFIEVKGVTLEEDNIALFPDAPTERGIKHIKELIKAVLEGYDAYIVFIVQMKGVFSFATNIKMHPEFGCELQKAIESGVHVLCFDSYTGKDYISLGDPVPVTI
ncbi:MAG: DNA/RNA nuclease SfsA [Acetivibrionales bacterium]